MSIFSKQNSGAKNVSAEQATALSQANHTTRHLGVVVEPIMTEKAARLAALGQYTFNVSVKANKIQIAQAIEKRYDVKPASVNIINYPGKFVHFGRQGGVTKSTKKAIVTLPKGKTINVYEGV